jgi:hypothetical protein
VPTEQRHESLDTRRGIAQRGDRDQRATKRTNRRVQHVPQRVEVRNLVGEELDEVQHERCADDDRVVERLELRRQIDPPVPRREPEDGDVA